MQPQELWRPGCGMELHHEYPIPTPEALRQRWCLYAGRGEIITIPDIYGALKVPTNSPRAFASIDVCQVLRKTHQMLRQAEGLPSDAFFNMHRYNLSYSNPEDITTVLQVMLTNGLAEPEDHIEEIANTLRGWRANGVYTFINTATDVGCENGTIDFLNRYLPGCLDGILFTRNHKGTLPLTKGLAAKSVIDAFRPTDGPFVAVHIDDSPQHNISFRQCVGMTTTGVVATFIPVYQTHYDPDNGSVNVPTPYEAFKAADQFFNTHITTTK